MYIVYSLLLACLLLLSSPWWIFQILRQGKYRAGLRERLGRVPQRLSPANKGGIWIHAVSVGEVLAIGNLVRELEQYPVFVSTTTKTGQEQARSRFGESKSFFLPIDMGFAIRPYLNVLQPRLLVLAETEFWPNLLHLAQKRSVKVAVVNARISDRSFPRYRKFRWFFSRVLENIDLFLTQTEEDARRLAAIGAPPERIQVSGNLKFDIRPAANSEIVNELRQALPQGSPVIVCGSTTEGEEEILLRGFKDVLRQHPSAVMVLAPRHPERFDKVANLISTMEIGLVRRSSWPASCPVSGGVFLLDSVGELASIYALADVAFVGGSLAPVGGHNILEPAQYGIAVMTGPHTFNFREIVRIFEQGGGLKVVTEQQLSQELLRLLQAPEARALLGTRAKDLFLQNTGATRRTVAALQQLLAGKRAQ